MAEIIYKVITDADVKRALDYIAENGKPYGKHGILHIDNNERARARNICVKHNGKRLSIREVLRVAFLSHFGEKFGDSFNLPQQVRVVAKRQGLVMNKAFISFLRGRGGLTDENFVWLNARGEETPRFGRKKYKPESVVSDDGGDESADEEAYDLLMQFNQIIFDGPPGTGKTRRAINLLPDLLDEDEGKVKSLQGERWDIVQFHPSYNYEDFVRGVKVETTKSGGLAYKTENRIFGDICERAENHPKNHYVLIIDEINRANVSAVLGELIYALEYRGQKIKTPYRVGDSDMLIIPENLYIIGTMNTADRTIGQIDYAVRRRFAFIHCLPDESVIPAGEAENLFHEVNGIFEGYITQDYVPDDVRIGHSYFLASGGELANKIIYQVVPILREYVKDGVLSKDAEGKIDELKGRLETGTEEPVASEEGGEADDSNPPSGKAKQQRRIVDFVWKNKKNGKTSDVIKSKSKTVVSIVRDYVENHPNITVQELQKWFPDKGKGQDIKTRGIKLKSEVEKLPRKHQEKWFAIDEPIAVEGELIYVPSVWSREFFAHFKAEMAAKNDGYIITEAADGEDDSRE